MRRFRRPVHTYERHERKPGKKISFYWQQVGFDSVSSQQRPRLDAFYTENIFFQKDSTTISKKSRRKKKQIIMGNSNSSRNFKSLRKSFRRAGSSDQIICSFKTNHKYPRISTGSLRTESNSSNRNGLDYSRSHSLASNTTSSDVSSRVSVGPMDDQDQIHMNHSKF